MIHSHRDRKISKHVNAYIVFKEVNDATKALELNGFEYKGHILRVELVNRCEKKSVIDDTEANKRTLFVGNIKPSKYINTLLRLLKKIGIFVHSCRYLYFI